VPKVVVNLENLFDWKNRFRGPPNIKTNSSIIGHEVINLGIVDNPTNINLGKGCSK